MQCLVSSVVNQIRDIKFKRLSKIEQFVYGVVRDADVFNDDIDKPNSTYYIHGGDILFEHEFYNGTYYIVYNVTIIEKLYNTDKREYLMNNLTKLIENELNFSNYVSPILANGISRQLEWLEIYKKYYESKRRTN